VQLPADERDTPQARPAAPCAVCGEPAPGRPICERYPLCQAHFADWFEDRRFEGNNLAQNALLTAGWIAEKQAAP
jgi:hypothetical protein